jgi:hypothetical protein
MFSDSIRSVQMLIFSARRLAARAHRTIFYLTAGIVSLLLTGTVWGQSTFGQFVGTVRDPLGAAITAAVVKAVNTGTSATRSTVTDASGEYTLVNIEPGDYQLSVEAPGFQVAKFSGITLTARQDLRQDAILALTTQSQVVNVSEAAAAPISTEVSNIAETKLGRELIDLPVAIYSRSTGSTSPITTLSTQPGVQTDASGNLSIAGEKPAMLSTSLDGISTVSPKGASPITELFPSFDGIAEIRVSEINNTAEFGGVSDITTISKSGGNIYHGSLYEINQVSALDARNRFSAVKPHLTLNDYGASLGGPVAVPKLYHGKNKTFFFMDFESLQKPNQSLVFDSFPTAAMRNGDLSVYLPTAIKDPLNSGQTFPNNQIPLTRIAPLSLAAENYFFPLPNYGAAGAIANNYQQLFPANISSNAGDMRIDKNITSKNTAFARLTYKRRETETAPSGSPILGGGTSLENDYGISGADNYVITPNMVNEARVGYTGSNTGSNYNYTAGAIQTALGLQLAGPAPPGAAAPSFSVSGFTGTTGGSTGISKTNTFQVLDNFTWTRGKHNVKFGGDYRYYRGLYTNVFAGNRMGSYSFNNSVTKSFIGNPFGAFLLGIPDSSGMDTVLNPNTFGYAHADSIFVQDDWKVTSRFTVNYGLRWEYHPAFRDHYNNTADFLPNYYSDINGVTVHGAVVIPDLAVPLLNPGFVQSIAPTPVLTATQAGIPQSLKWSPLTDFAPRVGFAWRVTADGKTVIRAGYGKFIEAELGNAIDAAWAVEASDVAKFTNSFSGGKPLYSFPYALPSNLAIPGSQQFDFANDVNYRDPYVQQWNFTIERDLGFQTGLRLTYSGSHGSNLGIQENIGQIPMNTVGYAAGAATGPYPLWNSIIYDLNGGRSNYNAFTATVNKRMSKGLQFQSSYSFAKDLSNDGGSAPSGFPGEGGGTITNPQNPNFDYGPVAYTRRQRFLTTFLYAPQFHIGNRIASQVANGWEVAGVVLFQTGPFLTVTNSSADPSGTNAPNLGGGERVDVVPGVSPYAATWTTAQALNPAAFIAPANNIGRFGNEPIGYVNGPGTEALSLSMFRSIVFKERVRLRFGISAANAFNHENYGNPALNQATASTFGTTTSLQTAEGAGPRQIQMTGRITF